MKKIAKFVLTITATALISGCVSVYETKQSPSGTGTLDITWYTQNPGAATFEISNADQLAGLAQLVNNGAGLDGAVDFQNKTLRLTQNIDLSKYGRDAKFNNGKGWVPIGKRITVVDETNTVDEEKSLVNAFGGEFDGNGKSITGLHIHDDSLSYAGLFGVVGFHISDKHDENAKATVKNLTLKDVDINAFYAVGGVAGKIMGWNNSVEDCNLTGVVRGHSMIGGLAGCLDVGNIFNSHVVGEVASRDSAAGGVAGELSGSSIVWDSSFHGSVCGSNDVGGVAGTLWTGEVLNCHSSGAVNGYRHVGGVAGFLRGSVVAHSYSLSDVAGHENVGGVVGILSRGYVVGCYSTGGLKGNLRVGGVVGWQVFMSNVNECAALNPGITLLQPKAVYGRVTSYDYVPAENETTVDILASNTLSNNVAFVGMANPDVGNAWYEKKTEGQDGADISAAEIKVDPSLGGRFKSENGWTLEPGKLPGLGGKAVDLPQHLR